MRKLVLAGIVTALLSGCEDGVEANEIRAIQQCVQRSLQLQGYKFSDGDQPEQEGDRFLLFQGLKLYDRARFRFDSSAHFVIDYGDVMLPWPKQAYRLKCAGDFTFKAFDRVEVNGRVYQPNPGESWRFAGEADEAAPDQAREPESPAPQNAAGAAR